MAGCLPAVAVVHLKMLSLLGMISRLEAGSILQEIGRNALLSATPNKKSWFIKIREICTQYCLPDPLLVLQDEMSKEAWKNKCKATILSYWGNRLRGQSKLLPSLIYFQPQFMSLVSPHSLWLLPETGYEVQKSVVVANML